MKPKKASNCNPTGVQVWIPLTLQLCGTVVWLNHPTICILVRLCWVIFFLFFCGQFGIWYFSCGSPHPCRHSVVCRSGGGGCGIWGRRTRAAPSCAPSGLTPPSRSPTGSTGASFTTSSARWRPGRGFGPGNGNGEFGRMSRLPWRGGFFLILSSLCHFSCVYPPSHLPALVHAFVAI